MSLCYLVCVSKSKILWKKLPAALIFTTRYPKHQKKCSTQYHSTNFANKVKHSEACCQIIFILSRHLKPSGTFWWNSLLLSQISHLFFQQEVNANRNFASIIISLLRTVPVTELVTDSGKMRLARRTRFFKFVSFLILLINNWYMFWGKL